MNILIVDDERLILLGLKSVLEKNKDVPCIVETASSAEAALHKLEVFPTDLMITDVEMPSVNGLELIRTVQNRKLCSHFIILSGHDSFDYAKTGNSFIFAPDRRIVFVTNSIYQAARVAILFDRKYGNVQCQTSPFYHFGVTSVSSQIHADSLRIYDFTEAQRYENSDDILNSPAIRELPAECSQLYIGMRDYHDPVKMVKALNNAGGKFQFFMVSEEDLYTDWFDALQREENTHIIRLSEPDDSYYRGIVEELVGVLERTFDITLGDIDAGRIVYLARLKYGIGINRNLSEEDLVWYINKAVLYASAQKRDAIMAEDFEKFLPDHQDL